MNRFDVVIVGYGPVGQTLALMLARQGRKVAVATTGAVELFLGWDVLEITQDGTVGQHRRARSRRAPFYNLRQKMKPVGAAFPLHQSWNGPRSI